LNFALNYIYNIFELTFNDSSIQIIKLYMPDNKIYDFKLRGNYPNYNYVKFIANKNKNLTVPEGYITPEAEYWYEKNGDHFELKVSYNDIPFLSVDDKEIAIKYLINLINANNGDEKAKLIVEKKRKNLYNECNSFVNENKFIENEYVIPSVTAKTYNQEDVSNKGAMLLNLYKDGYPVPDFCILSSHTYKLDKKERASTLVDAINNLEKMTGKKLGSYDKPLVFAMRCGMPRYIPGLMPTYLNVGVTKETYQALIKIYGDLVASKIYIHNLKTIYNLLYPRINLYLFENILEKNELSEIHNGIDFFYISIADKDEQILTNPYYQVNFFLEESRKFFVDNKDLLYTFVKNKDFYPAIILQKMVWTVRDNNSYPGVLYSRHSRTGLGKQIESVRNIFGEEIMTGNINVDQTEFFNRDEIKEEFPAIYHFCPLLPKLEKKLRSAATVEFAAESSSTSHFFAILQLNESELTGRATLLSSIDLYKNGIIDKKRVIELIHPYHLRHIFSETIDDKSYKNLEFFSNAVSVLPRSAVAAQAYFSAKTALDGKRRGEKVCFIKEHFVPSDTIVMGEVDAIISVNPVAIHVVTACRGYGIPAFLNLENYKVKLSENMLINEKGLVINEGDWITMSSKYQMLFLGKAKFKQARFKRYLDGEKFELEPKEKKVFENMAFAFNEYQRITNSIDLKDIDNLNELLKYIRTDLKKDEKKAQKIVNHWFDTYTGEYVQQVLESTMGSHKDQHELYHLLTIERKVILQQKIILLCRKNGLKGFTAGSFMIGRFINISHPVAFWKKFNATEITFLLNEFILFEKYMQLLNDVGERNINRARKELLTGGLGNVNVNEASAKIFTTLKLAKPPWQKIGKIDNFELEPETHTIIMLLQKPYDYFYDYNVAWSVNKLKRICEEEKVGFPNKMDV